MHHGLLLTIIAATVGVTTILSTGYAYPDPRTSELEKDIQELQEYSEENVLPSQSYLDELASAGIYPSEELQLKMKMIKAKGRSKQDSTQVLNTETTNTSNENEFETLDESEEEEPPPASETFLDEIRGEHINSIAEAERLPECVKPRVIRSGDKIALQIDNQRFYLGCTRGPCENFDCASYEFSVEDRQRCYCSVFEIYRMQGPGEVKVGDIVGIHYPHDPGTWVGCPNQNSCSRSGCPGQPNILYGFAARDNWFYCGGEVFQIYSMNDERPVGEPIQANDKIGLYYLHGRNWLSFTGEGGTTRAWPCPDNNLGQPPPRSAFEICYGESFTLIDLQ